MSGVNEALVELWVVGEAVKKVGIHKHLASIPVLEKLLWCQRVSIQIPSQHIPFIIISLPKALLQNISNYSSANGIPGVTYTGSLTFKM